MGIKHLEKIEKLLKKNKNHFFSKNEIRENLKMNWVTIEDSLAYLIGNKKVETINRVGETERYRWA